MKRVLCWFSSLLPMVLASCWRGERSTQTTTTTVPVPLRVGADVQVVERSTTETDTPTTRVEDATLDLEYETQSECSSERSGQSIRLIALPPFLALVDRPGYLRTHSLSSNDAQWIRRRLQEFYVQVSDGRQLRCARITARNTTERLIELRSDPAWIDTPHGRALQHWVWHATVNLTTCGWEDIHHRLGERVSLPVVALGPPVQTILRSEGSTTGPHRGAVVRAWETYVVVSTDNDALHVIRSGRLLFQYDPARLERWSFSLDDCLRNRSPGPVSREFAAVRELQGTPMPTETLDATTPADATIPIDTFVH